MLRMRQGGVRREGWARGAAPDAQLAAGAGSAGGPFETTTMDARIR